MPTLSCLPLVLGLAMSGQATQSIPPLGPDTPVEHEIAGGESQTYRVTLGAGQFVRFRLDQRAVDTALTLTSPDGKQLVEMDLTAVGEQETIGLESAVPGDYHVTVRSDPSATWRGSYRLETSAPEAATLRDRTYVAAQALMLEATELQKQGPTASHQAIAKLEQALPMWRELAESGWIAIALVSIGDVQASAGQSDAAVASYESALTACRESKLRAGEARVLDDLASASYDSRQYEKAIEYWDQALAIRRELKDRAGEGIVLNSLGIGYNTMRRADKAVECYEQSLAIKRELKDRVGEAGTLHDVGYAYMAVSRSDEALLSFERALAIRRDMKNRRGEADALSGLGITNMSISHFEKAIEYYEQTLAIQRELKDRHGEGVTLSDLGVAYASLRRYDKFIEYAEQALAINRETKSRFAEGRTLSDLGSVYARLGNLEKAIDYLEQALAINREVRDRQVEASTLLSLGSTYATLGRSEKAIEYYEQALALSRDMKNRPQEAAELNNLAKQYRLLQQYEKAVEYGTRSLAIAREVKNPEYELFALSNLAASENARGSLVPARADVEAALRVAESLRSDVVSPASRASLLASVQSSYELYTDILMRQYKADPTKGLDALAVDVSERQRARSLLDLLTEAGADVRRGVDPTLIERERTLAKQLNDKARTPTSTPEQAAALKLEISQLETDYERAQVAIRKANPHYAALVQPEPLKLAGIQQQLDGDTLLLEYALGDERSYVWAITKTSLASYELPKAAEIERSALDVYELLTARSTNVRGESATARQQRVAEADAKLPAAAEALSRTVLAPVAGLLGNRRLAVVADGALQYVPFAMLPDPVAGGNQRSTPQPLIVGHEVVSLASASALAVQRKELAGRQPAPKMLAVIADPVFDRSDQRFAALAIAKNDEAPPPALSPNDARSIEHLAESSTDAPGGTIHKLVIPRLPFTRQEANQLIALAPRGSSLQAMDFQASRATVLSGDLSQYRYVHFATHGWLDSERPGLSSLVLSTVDAQGKPQDGFLRANDIYNLKLPADLVVLSACQTGLGKNIKGEGLIGLTRGFMYAGAARVVVSLWDVNDRATADLMTEFYEKMLKQEERPAAALRAAQVAMWKQKRWQSPYYWAAFVLQGEWR